MSISFSKWQGTGNDFILLDDREGQLGHAGTSLAQRLCDRHFGIGSDGLILLQKPKEAGTDYHMEFFNPDGSQSFCGNGSRCAYAFYGELTGHRTPMHFSAIDGVHQARWREGEVEVSMRDTVLGETLDAASELLNTGSPHLVLWVADPDDIDIIPAGRHARYGPRFKEKGVNVNFVNWRNGELRMRTYERGVEDETLSCGTGVTAAALSAMARGHGLGGCTVRTRGGILQVTAERKGDTFTDVWLRGPVAEVFRGTIELNA